MALMPGASIVLISAPTAEPITLAEAKLHLRVDTTDDDVLITDLIMSAREYAEDFQGRAFITQIRELVLDNWPGGGTWLSSTANSNLFSYGIGYRSDYRTGERANYVELPYPPLRAVESVKYADSAGVQATWDTTNYFADKAKFIGRVVLGYGKSWPTATLLPSGAIVIRYTAGYATPFTVDAATDILTAAGHPYANGDRIRLSNSGGSLPAGLTDTRDYYAIGVSGDTLQLALTSGGLAVDITGTGTGTHFLGVVPRRVKQAMKLLIGHWYENRELYVTGAIATKLGETVDALLTWDRATPGVS